MIRLEGIRREFRVGDQLVRALDGVDLSIENGAYLSIMGPSGSGKSTLLNMIGLLDRPDAGRYWLDEQDVSGLDEAEQARVRSKKIGFVFQFFHLVPRLTAAENIGLPLVLAGIDAKERKHRVAELLDALGLSNRADHLPDQLSGGQRQRVAIGRATIMQPEVLLADEPTGNLDQHSGQDVLKVLEGMNDTGITLIIVTHDANIGARSARRVRIVDGKIERDTCENS